MTEPLTPGVRLEPAPDLRTIDRGRILLGGAPFRVLRLSTGGADLARRWFAGEPIQDTPTHHDLARRLENAGMAHLRWPAAERGQSDITVIIPSRDDRGELDRTLRCRPESWANRVIVVDDGSDVPIPIPVVATASPSPIEVIRRDRSGGPGQARQSGLEGVETELVLFVDAGVTLGDEVAAGLGAAFADPTVVAAAPRVLSALAPGLTGRYDRHRSPIDLGPVESPVGPGRAVPYVPTACLAVRTSAIRQVGGFDPDLRYGEDVDLVWRLGQQGQIRYLPNLEVTHQPRATIGALATQRRRYGTAAAPLASRHGGGALAPARVSGWSALILGLALAGRPVAAGATAVGTALALAPKLRPMPNVKAEALALTLRGHWYGSLGILTASIRSWAPALVPTAVVIRRARRPIALALAAGAARRLLDGPRRPVDAGIDLAVGLVDDLAYGTGLWQGAIGQRSTAALRPVLAAWPDPAGRWRDRARALLARRPSRFDGPEPAGPTRR